MTVAMSSAIHVELCMYDIFIEAMSLRDRLDNLMGSDCYRD